jgi:AcrR family transcriptional regulator
LWTAAPNNRKENFGKPLKRSQSAKSAERRREIIHAAYRTLAEKGFEGLRMREIAKRAGIDHSTLHYYFAGKEKLIDGVVDHIVRDLGIGRTPAVESAALSPCLRLAAHFDALIKQLQETPEMFIVLAELHARSMREPVLRSIFSKNDQGWKAFLTELLEAGIRGNEFKAKFLPEVVAETIISLIRGLAVTCAGRPERMKSPLDQLLVWLKG